MDDLFGYGSDPECDINWWIRQERLISSILQGEVSQDANRLIITMRNDIYNEFKSSLQASQCMFTSENVVDLSSPELQFKTGKKSILNMYLSQIKGFHSINDSDVNEIINTSLILGFPECCRIFMTTPELRADGVQFFKNPLHYLQCIIKERFNEQKQRALLFLLLSLGKVALDSLKDDILKLNHNVIEKTFEIELPSNIRQNLFPDISSKIACLKEGLKALCGSFVKCDTDTGNYIFSHDSVLDAVTVFYGKMSPISFLENCNCNSLRYVVTSRCKNVLGKIEIQLFLFPYLYRRIFDEIQSNNVKIYSLLASLTPWEDERFLLEFFKWVDKEENIQKEFYFLPVVKTNSTQEAFYNDTDILGKQSFFVSVAKVNNHALLKCFLERSSKSDTQMKPALDEALSAGNTECVILLLDKGTEPDEKSVFSAVESGKIKLLEKLIPYGVIPTAKSDKSRTQQSKYLDINILHEACLYKGKRHDMVELLIKTYPSLCYQKDKHGTSVLHFLTMVDNLTLYRSVEKIILSRKTDTDCNKYMVELIESSEGKSVLHLACLHQNVELCKYLCKKYPSLISRTDKNGWHCLHYAAQSGNIDCYKYLESVVLKGKTDTECEQYMKQLTERSGDMTVLHTTSLNGNADLCKYLCTKYPSLLSRTNKNDWHCLHFTAQSGNVDCFKYLESLVLQGKADIECQQYMEQLKEKTGDMAVLHIASLNGNTELCNYLCTRYPSFLSLRATNAWHCLHLVAQSGNIDCFKYLESLVLKDKTDIECEQYMKQLTEMSGDMTVLHIASLNGNTELCKYLCTRYPFLLSLRARNGWHCLHFTAQSGNVDCFKYLESLVYEGKTDIECQQCMEKLKESSGDVTVLHTSCVKGNTELCKYLCTKYPYLLTQRARNGWHCLHHAAQSGNVDCFKYLESLILKDETDIECQRYMEQLTEMSEYMTVLHITSFKGNTDLCKYLCTKYPSLLSQKAKNDWHCLHQVAQSGNVDCYKYLESLVLQGKTDIGCQQYMDQLTEKTGDMAVLHIASLNGNTELCKYLCTKYPSLLSHSNKHGLHCLHFAAYYGNIDCYKYLESMVLEGNTDIECQQYMEQLTEFIGEKTVLHIACFKGNTDLCKYLCTKYPYLISHRAKNGYHCLHLAAQSGNVDCFKYLESLVLEYKTDIECQQYMERLTEFSEDKNVLHIACFNGNTKLCMYLCTKYSSLLSQRNGNDRHFLHNAAHSGNVDCYKYLESLVLQGKTDVECQQYMEKITKSSDDKTVLHITCFNGNAELCKYLCTKYPSFIAQKDNKGWHCFHYTAYSGNVECFEYLESLILKDKTYIECQHYMEQLTEFTEDMTVLHVTCVNGNIELCKYLSSKYPSLLLKRNKNGFHCLHHVAQSGNVSCYKYLESLVLPGKTEHERQQYMEQHTEFTENKTVLHISCFKGNTELCKYLCTNYPSLLSKTNKNGWHCLHYIAQSGNVGCYKYLESLVLQGKTSTECQQYMEQLTEFTENMNVLHITCLNGNTELCKYLCTKYPSLLAKTNKNGWHCLHHAAYSGNAECYKYLESLVLQGKTNIECLQYMEKLTELSEYKTVVQIACFNGNTKLCKYLCSNYPLLISHGTKYGWHCLHYAAHSGNVDCYKYLESLVLQGKTDNECQECIEQLTELTENKTVLHVACINGNTEICKYLCTNYPYLLSQTNKNGWHCLHYAAQSGNVDCYKYLESLVLQGHTRIVCQEYMEQFTELSENKTVLHIACLSGKTDICKYLCTNYPSLLSLRVTNGQHCLHHTAQSGNVDCYKYLESLVLQGKTYIECQQYMKQLTEKSRDMSVLHITCLNGNTELCRYLCTKYPPLLSKRNKYGWHCLHFAAYLGYVDCYKYLESLVLQGKTDIECQEYMEQLREFSEDKNVLHVACFKGITELCKYLCTNFPSLISQRAKNGWHYLHYAAYAGNVECYKYLESLVLQGKTDIECQQYMEKLKEFTENNTVLHIACLSGNTDLCKYLCINYPSLLSSTLKDGRHSLHNTAESGNIDCYKYIESLVLEGKTDIERQQHIEKLTDFSEYKTVLHITCYNGNTELCKYLCTTYPSLLSKRNKNGWNCLHYAAHSGNVDCYKYLEPLVLQGKTDTECQKYMEQLTEFTESMNVLFITCVNGNTKLCAYLCTKYPNLLSKRNTNGCHCLHYVAKSGSSDCFKYLESLVLQGKTENERQQYIQQLTEFLDKKTVLHISCRLGNTELSKYLCTIYPSLLSQTDKDGWNCLHCAAASGNIDCYQYLESLVLQCKTDFECQQYMEQLKEFSEDRTVLHISCRYGHTELCKYICTKYPSLMSHRAKNGYHCLYSAAVSGNVDCYKYLESLVLQGKTDIECQQYIEHLTEISEDMTVLHIACFNENIELCKYLCTNYPSLLSLGNKNGWHYLHITAQSGNVNCFKYLESLVLKDKTYIECLQYLKQLKKNLGGMTVLHTACFNGNIEICKYLCTKYPPLLSLRGKNGYHCLHYTAQSGNVDCFKYVESLVVQGKNYIECKQYMEQLTELSEDMTVLHIACCSGNTELCYYLHTRYPSLLTQRSKRGRHCLHWVASSGNVACYSLLELLVLQGKTYIECQHYLQQLTELSWNKTVLHVACFNGNTVLCKYLCTKYPSLLSQRYKHGGHCLHLAAASGNVDCYKYLESCVLQGKPECEQYILTLKESGEDKNVLHMACRNGNTELCKYLCTTFTSLLTQKSKNDMHCLHHAARSGNVTCYQYIESLVFKDKTQSERNNYMEQFVKCAPNKSILNIVVQNGNEVLYQYLCTEYPKLFPTKKKSCTCTIF